LQATRKRKKMKHKLLQAFVNFPCLKHHHKQ
jgi:hypothetical protein